MSDNKYIIDKDSLTGIADAIRNKLGNGASIDDPAAGYYPDPTKSTFLAKFTTVGGRHQTGNSRYCHIAIWGISASDMTAAFGDTICGYLRITSLGDPVSAGSDARDVEQREFSIIPYMNSSYATSKKFTWAKDATILLPIGDYYSSEYGQPSAGILFSWQDSGNYKYNYDITVPDIKIEFLDQNQNLMTPAIGSFSDALSGWSSVSKSGDLTHTFEGEIGYSSIPYSIADMQDKITNYLIKSTQSQPTYQVDENYKYYNGCLLPTLPEASGYSNIIIRENTQTGYYDAFYCSSSWYSNSGTLDDWNLTSSTISSFLHYRIPLANGTSWQQVTGETFGAIGTNNNRKIIWTSTNITIGSGGNVLLRSSQAAPYYSLQTSEEA